MKQYQKIEDFLLDQSFQAWLEGDAEATAFWRKWREQNPNKLAMLNQAKAMVYTLKQYTPDISSEEVTEEVSDLVRQAKQRKQATVFSEDIPIRLWQLNPRNWLRFAASILVVLSVGLGYRLFKNSTDQTPSVYNQLLSEAPAVLLEKVNTTNQPLTLVLSDGSAITLEKASRISYPKAFAGNFREVYLSGEAFFEVAHNPKKPFLVYANETVTKVLGTSFRIRAFDSDQEVKVAVKTGKVSVYSKTTFQKENRQKGNELKGVLLIPNQEVVFYRATENLQKGLVEKPELIATPTHIQELDVDDMPVSEVLQKLEKAYGIDIVYNEDLLRKCPVTAQFSDETLYDKLTFICQAIGANYEVLDGQIVINSAGCQP